jgi:chromosome segregation ATPase
MTFLTIILLAVTAEGFSSVSSTLVLIATTIAGFVAWIRERKKRKHDDMRGRVDIMNLLNKQNEDLNAQLYAVRKEVTDLKIAQRDSDSKIGKLEAENQQLKSRQNELIAENKRLTSEVAQVRDENVRLNSELDSLRYAGKRKVPAPKKKETE